MYDSSENMIAQFKTVSVDDDFSVEYEILSVYDYDDVVNDERKHKIALAISNIEEQDKYLDEKISQLNIDIARLTNHADGLDYAIAVSSGILCGLIDSFVVGEWNFKDAKAYSNKQVNEKVMQFAKKHGYEGNRLDGAVKFLESKFKLPGDADWKFPNSNITAKTHHLDDFCHHPTLVGLICNVIVQFTGKSIYSNRDSELIRIPITINEYGQFQGKNPVTKMFSGVINWFLNVAKTMSNAKGHWMSDMAGSHSSAGGGAGLPGSVMSLLKELSALPIFKDTNFAENLRKAYQNGIGTGAKQIDLGAFNGLFEGASSKFDIRTENAIKIELKRQAMPIIINEVLVRGFYFVRRFISEVKQHNNLAEINWKNVIPLNNRTIARMMTISSGTFTAFDLADAAVRSVAKNGTTPAFWKDFILRINFVGIGRFVIAVGVDVGMGIKRQSLIKERMQYNSEKIMLQTAKFFYLQEGMWIEAENTQKAMKELYDTAEKSIIYFNENWLQIEDSLKNIQKIDIDEVERKNPKLGTEIKDILEWG